MIQRIELFLFFSTMTQRIELFVKMTYIELSLFYEPLLNKSWTFFEESELKELNLLWMYTTHRVELIFLRLTELISPFFLEYEEDWTFLFTTEYDSKNWSFFFFFKELNLSFKNIFTWLKESNLSFFNLLWLKESNPFFLMFFFSQKIELFSKKMTQRIEHLFQKKMTQRIEPSLNMNLL